MQYTHPASFLISLSLFLSVSLCKHLSQSLFLSISQGETCSHSSSPRLPLYRHPLLFSAHKYSNMRGLHQKQTHTLMIRKMQIYVRVARSLPLSLTPKKIRKQHLCPLVPLSFWFPTNDLACVTSAIQFIHSSPSRFTLFFVLRRGN